MGPIRKKWLATAAITIASSAALGACGGDDETTSTATTSAATGASGATSGGAEALTVSETEYALDPADPSVEAGTVTIEATNDGEIAHSLEVEGPSGEEELPEDLQPGDSGTLEVDLSEPGTYKWYCPIGNHEQEGMVGEITVK